ncbi:hypothetical protein EB796_006860 [Bugula neritina]|uniref:Uncharacterized protein n=1 Tax=Bugula neritina TaxID=10212 RepID=A0A7J7K862_BUGNE|nr:hypothetical protein EB796_006860 [Bugula neritina]
MCKCLNKNEFVSWSVKDYNIKQLNCTILFSTTVQTRATLECKLFPNIGIGIGQKFQHQQHLQPRNQKYSFIINNFTQTSNYRASTVACES